MCETVVMWCSTPVQTKFRKGWNKLNWTEQTFIVPTTCFSFWTLEVRESISRILYRLTQTQNPRVHPLTQRLNTWQAYWIFLLHFKIQTRFRNKLTVYFKLDSIDHFQQTTVSHLACLEHLFQNLAHCLSYFGCLEIYENGNWSAPK